MPPFATAFDHNGSSGTRDPLYNYNILGWKENMQALHFIPLKNIKVWQNIPNKTSEVGMVLMWREKTRDKVPCLICR